VGQRGSQLGRTRAVRSEKDAVLRHGAGTGRCGIAAGVARALQKCPGRTCMVFLLRPQDVRRVDNSGTQCDPKTWGSFIQYIPSGRIKGKLYDPRVCPYHQGLACCTCVSRSRRPATARSAGRPQSSGALGEECPERARDKTPGGFRMVTCRVSRIPGKAHQEYIYYI
jgi:hypothetical protein